MAETGRVSSDNESVSRKRPDTAYTALRVGVLAVPVGAFLTVPRDFHSDRQAAEEEGGL